MLRWVMKEMGLIGKPQNDEATSSEDEFFIAQWKDSAGSWHTDVYDGEPTDLGPRRWKTDAEPNYRERPVYEGYALTRLGAWRHRHTAVARARRAQIKQAKKEGSLKTFKVKK